MRTDEGEFYHHQREVKRKSNSQFQDYCKELIIDFCSENDLLFKSITDYQFRISGNYNGITCMIDVFPNSCKLHNIKTNARYRWPEGDLLGFIEKQLKN